MDKPAEELQRRALAGEDLSTDPRPAGVDPFTWKTSRAALTAFLRLEARVALVEAAHKVKGVYRGRWKGDGTRYRKGDLLTDRGSLWHANCDTTERPGTSSSWTLTVKKGRAGSLEK